jgi:Asp-tRNA(Asn)/Glu-tRNA(Gln) amidotransferase C subunit
MAEVRRITADTVRQLAAAAGIRPDESSLEGIARGLDGMIGLIERCEEMGLSAHEPATTFTLTGGASDAER